jgi:hypothetical protein
VFPPVGADRSPHVGKTGASGSIPPTYRPLTGVSAAPARPSRQLATDTSVKARANDGSCQLPPMDRPRLAFGAANVRTALRLPRARCVRYNAATYSAPSDPRRKG